MIVNKEKLIRLISKKSRFNLGDTRILLDTLIQVFEEQIAEGNEIDIYGFGKIIVQELPERDGSPLVTDGEKLPPAKRLYFRLSENIRRLVK